MPVTSQWGSHTRNQEDKGAGNNECTEHKHPLQDIDHLGTSVHPCYARTKRAL